MSKTPKQYSYICPICGKSFTAHRVLNRYCSEECRRNARREQDRNRKKEVRVQRSEQRSAERADADRKKAEQIEARRRQVKEDFARRCEEGDPAALMFREKATNGNSTLKYWELFAESAVQNAEDAGTVSEILVNGVSVYEDGFAEKVMQSIKESGCIYTRTASRSGRQRDE